ncbi:MAG: alpha-galactosidase [Clostridiales bacterium]|jgi:alpha-galactosidase|nr:alpha-galactosidase [Clostridiales bacterium]
MILDNADLYIKYTPTDGGDELFTDDSNDDIVVERHFDGNADGSNNGVLDIFIKTARPIKINQIGLIERYGFKPDTVFFGNGHQSWTDTREYRRSDKMRDLGAVGKDKSKFQFWQRLTGSNGASMFKKQSPEPIGDVYVNAGDYLYANYERRTGFFHSVSYTYLKNDAELTLIGSLNERTGYTVIYADMPAGILKIEKDLEGVIIDGEYHVFSLFIKDGGYDEVFDAYFDRLGAKPRAVAPLKGYTSWYNYYSNINQDIILRDLDALSAAAPEINAFQIDDGFQTAVGDWLSIDSKKFPDGMKVIADAIHKKGLKAGLWLAPLAAQHDSKILAEHPEWFIKNPDGKNRKIGHNWGGFYGLNFYLPEVRAHIKNFFDVVLNQWGYDLVKLDFLYAASVLPLNGKTRAENMFDAMQLIRECVGDKEILGCGVPIMPCVNQVEYMRIGADMGLSWSQFIFGMVTTREDVNTRNAVHNGINRRHLNKRVFMNDPDVFLLRDYNINMTAAQKELLARLIKLNGGVFFTSDDVNRYGEEQKKILKYMFSDPEIKVGGVVFKNNIYTIEYTENGVEKTLSFSMKNGKIL